MAVFTVLFWLRNPHETAHTAHQAHAVASTVPPEIACFYSWNLAKMARPSPAPRRLHLLSNQLRPATAAHPAEMPTLAAVKEQWRRLPPLGGATSLTDAAQLDTQLVALEQRVAALELCEPLAVDAGVMTKAVRYALQFDEFWVPARYALEGDTAVAAARRCLASADARLAELEAIAVAEPEPSWHARPGFAVRGYTSSVDASAQPFGLVIPEGLASAAQGSLPMYVCLAARPRRRAD